MATRTTREVHAADARRVTEKAFQAQVIQLAAICGFSVYHTWLSVRSAAGFPDLLLARAPHLIAVEVKSETGRLSRAQQNWLDLLAACGVETHVWKPSMWDEIVETLQRRGER